ncbi:hypothetical protein Glove_233g31 [Diversispora epigaea]|uniref:Protein kinase domain-containing protein n=1 Tax=Diversispora epigaea TaxID=1348612 RepID=A0A397II68_9GLOM|nr:hypothetical protein Glove_233g31 [Diversispora epigaea]
MAIIRKNSFEVIIDDGDGDDSSYGGGDDGGDDGDGLYASIWWCKPCNSKYFQKDFNNWTSGIDKIDKFIQDAQLMIMTKFKDVKQIGRGEFGKLFYTKWIDGPIGSKWDGWIDASKWDIEDQQWKKIVKVAVKK